MSFTLLVEQDGCLVVGHGQLAHPTEVLLITRVVRPELLLVVLPAAWLVVTPHDFRNVVFVLHPLFGFYK